MNFLPVNGLRVLASEVGMLCVLTALAYLGVRVYRRFRAGELQSPAFPSHPSVAVLLVIALALLGRGVMLPWVGIPHPRINDEFSYLLMGDTFAHGRLTNPTPPDWRHFETFHVNFVPTYHSKYPVSQGLALALGEVVGGQSWIGVYLSTALMCGAICWALQAFVPPGWALLGGLLAVFRIALFSYWMNSYWGGSLAALGGALALGAVVRVFGPSSSKRRRVLLASTFAASLLLLATSRPYEGLCFAVPLLVYFLFKLLRGIRLGELTLASTAVPVMVIGLAGLAVMGYYNRRTTGDTFLLPHLLNERTYSPLPLFLWQDSKADFSFRDPVFAKFFELTEREYHYQQHQTLASILSLEAGRFASDWFFYVGAALSFPAFVGFLSCVRQPKMRIVVLVALSAALGLALCIYTMPHYAAPATITIYVFATEGLRYLWDQGHAVERAFAIGIIATVIVSSLTRQTGSASINLKYAFPDIRRAITAELQKAAGKQLVLVSYDFDRHYPGDELVHNGADFNSEKILWARSKGSASDLQLCNVYSDRKFWSVITDDVTFSLQPIDLCKTKSADRP